jgi:hypothetical protein
MSFTELHHLTVENVLSLTGGGLGREGHGDRGPVFVVVGRAELLVNHYRFTSTGRSNK